MRRMLARKKDRHKSRLNTRREFAGVDGEGGNIDGRHEYLLLRAGDHTLETGEPLATGECLLFLSNLPPDRVYVSFFFDYDVTMILRDLPAERLTRLLDMDCRRIPGKPCTSLPVDVGPFQIEYIPTKEFRVRRKLRWNPEKKRMDWTRWIIISDTGSFFQTSFVKALQVWLGDEPDMGPVIEKIAEGKEQREEFTYVTHDEREYNHLECILLARMMEKFREMCDRVNIRPAKWQGPGNLVSAVMKREKVPRNKDITLFDTDPEIVRMANSGYYGGRFEVTRFGEIPGPIYRYDINSAYASTYGNLPCLLHGRWIKARRMPDSGIYMGQVHFKHRRGIHLGTLPVRGKHDGSLLFPVEGNGVYWSPELEIAKRYAELDWVDGYRYIQQCDCRNFDWVQELYAERKRLGSQGTGRVLKIALAATYGKLAQSVGCAPYSNPMWASLIVSNVRAKLITGAMSQDDGRHIVMLATDGIFSTAAIPELPIGEQLGEWDFKEYESLFTVQSGIYFIPGEAPKTRGTPQKRVLEKENEFRAVWDEILRTGKYGKVSVDVRTFIGLRLALARNKPELAGTWHDHSDSPCSCGETHGGKQISFDWAQKRFNGRFDGRSLVTDPIPGGPNLHSHPYDRVIGGIRAAERLQMADQPEWAPQLV